MSTKEKHLYYLSELKDYKVKSKDPDIRGWQVKDLDNRNIGKVDNLLVNKELGKVVYIDVEVDQSIIDINHDPYSSHHNSPVKEFINKEGENHIIIPIGLIDLNTDNKYVYTESLNYQTFSETKRYQAGTHINREYEQHVLDSYDRDQIRKRDNHHAEPEGNETPTKTKRYDSETEEQIRREKENLRYKSEHRSRPIDDHDRALHHHDLPPDLQPERTLDEDSNWRRDDLDPGNENSYKDSSRRNTEDDDFYDRREFRDRKF